MSMKKRINNKGFTLIELLAVIVILGILMMMAIPAVTKYIENSRKDAFYQTAKSYIEAARTPLLNGDYVVSEKDATFSDININTDTCDVPPFGYYTAIPITEIELEKGKGKSSFNRVLTSGYVIAINKGNDSNDDIEYYFVGVDEGENGISNYTSEANLKRSSVIKGHANKSNITNITNKGSITLSNTKYNFYVKCK